VSAHASPSERKPAFLSGIAASVFNRSRVDREQHVTGVELAEQAAKLRAVGLGCARHFTEPLANPQKQLGHDANLRNPSFPDLYFGA
jgi:hypothetical protein